MEMTSIYTDYVPQVFFIIFFTIWCLVQIPLSDDEEFPTRKISASEIKSPVQQTLRYELSSVFSQTQ